MKNIFEKIAKDLCINSMFDTLNRKGVHTGCTWGIETPNSCDFFFTMKMLRPLDSGGEGYNYAFSGFLSFAPDIKNKDTKTNWI